MIDRVFISLLSVVFALFTIFMSQANALTLKEMLSATKEKASKPHSGGDTAIKAQGIVAQKDGALIVDSFSVKDVELKVQEEVQGQYGDNIEIRFVPWHVPGGRGAKVTEFTVEEIEVNQQRTKVAALVHFQIEGHLKTLKVRGRLDHMISVPTLNRSVHYGELITKEDIAWTKVSGRKSNRFLITRPDDLIGRRPSAGFLKVDTPLYQRDVELVRAIEKGSMVTAHYKTARLDLKSKVRALEHGHKGESIRILNPDTNKILQGVVLGPNSVSLSPDVN